MARKKSEGSRNRDEDHGHRQKADRRVAGASDRGQEGPRYDDRFRDERDRADSYGSAGGWDEAGRVERERAPYPSMTVPGAAAGYYAPYLYGSHGGQRRGEARDERQSGGWGNDPYPMHGHRRNFMDKAADEVASWFGDEAAHMRREDDHRGRGPRNYRRSDARIEEDVNDRLTEDHMIDASDVTVTVAEREVTLDGHVTSRQAKRRAEDIAEAVSGVMHVQNNLRVKPAGAAQE